MPQTFAAVRVAIRAGNYRAEKHFRARAAERGFSVDDAVQMLTSADLLAWQLSPRLWLVTCLSAVSDHTLHVRVKLTRRRVLLLTGWLADPHRAQRRHARCEPSASPQSKGATTARE